ncbi:MAG TPA: tetraprenyl-beta-curcumene synthase family protein [Syntrophomonadaceae bacterium]|nr:tetraprenyl-beta-curcumene synthase family protein [Syntrophomonadaceae bacterium]
MSTVIELEKDPIKETDNRQLKILSNYVFRVIPLVNRKLKYWTNIASKIENEVLRVQALASLDAKAFHCQGGSVYAVNNIYQKDLIALIVAYQTICDYLDNLCDRAGVTEEKAFITLHQSLIDALTPNTRCSNYYSDYIYGNDSSYLSTLVDECREVVEKLPSYYIVQEEILALTELYINLQVKKHLDWDKREAVLIEWANHKGQELPSLKWQEYAAATGSTLGIFALFKLASKKDLQYSAVENCVTTYFPWICGLHILLDYLIDQEEDIEGGDLNFTFYYKDNEEMTDRLKLFGRNAKAYAKDLPPENFHLTVVQGLLAMYLSDEKVKKNGLDQIKLDLLNDMGGNTKNIYRLCKLVRRFI